MVVKITERCSMNCTHCFNRAHGQGPDMDFDMLEKVIQKLNEFPYRLLLISGGEPAEHPQLLMVMEYMARNLRRLKEIVVVLATNGLYFENHLELARKIHNLFPTLQIQVTNDRRFYPVDIDESKPFYRERYVTVCREVEMITPQGRALDNHIPTPRTASSCVNCRSIIHQIPRHTIEADIQALEAHHKFCTPTIGVDGMLRAGESSLCPGFASVEDDNATISRKLMEFRYNQCAETAGLNRHIPQMLKEMLGIG